jgi:hypothetical protein
LQGLIKSSALSQRAVGGLASEVARDKPGASENPLLLYQPGFFLTRRQEAEQIKQVPYSG